MKLKIFGIFLCYALFARDASVICKDYKLQSFKLKRAFVQDQADRLDDAVLGPEILKRDEKRRILVSKIFALGCFRSAADFYHAAMIYQHGTVPDHFYLTFTWANRSLQLSEAGSEQERDSRWLVAAGIDRYLVNIQHKQLFMTQFYRPLSSNCWCLNQIEGSFPKQKILEFTSKTPEEQFKALAELNAPHSECVAVKECTHLEALSTPQGFLPGFW